MSICQRSLSLDYQTISQFHYCFQSSDRKSSNCQMTEWRITDSNRWPPACKAGALASWANPPREREKRQVVPGRLELPTSTLSVWRSNQLSYRTGFKLSAYTNAQLHSFSIITNRSVSTRSEDNIKPSSFTTLSVFRYSETPRFRNGEHSAPERRCSSRTFRYGYLVTT